MYDPRSGIPPRATRSRCAWSLNMEANTVTIPRDSVGAGNPTHDASRAALAIRQGCPQTPTAGAFRTSAPAVGGKGEPCWS